jgi:hypothetical protein
MLNARFNTGYGKVAADVMVRALTTGERPEVLRKMRTLVWLERLVWPLVTSRKSKMHGDMQGVLDSVFQFASTFSGVALLASGLKSVFYTESVVCATDTPRRALILRLIESINRDARGLLLSRLLSAQLRIPQFVKKQVALGLPVDDKVLLAVAKQAASSVPCPALFPLTRHLESDGYRLLRDAFGPHKRFSLDATSWSSVVTFLERGWNMDPRLGEEKTAFLTKLVAFLINEALLARSSELEMQQTQFVSACRAVVRVLLESGETSDHGRFGYTLIPALMSGVNHCLETRASAVNGVVMGALLGELSGYDEGVKLFELYNVDSLLSSFVEKNPALLSDVLPRLKKNCRSQLRDLFEQVVLKGSRRLKTAVITSVATPTDVLWRLMENTFLEDERQACVKAALRRLEEEPCEADQVPEFRTSLPKALLLTLIRASQSHFETALANGWLEVNWHSAIETLSTEEVETELFEAVLSSEHGRRWVMEGGVQLLISVRGLLEDGETEWGVFDVLHMILAKAPNLLGKFELVEQVERLLAESEDLRQVEICLNFLLKVKPICSVPEGRTVGASVEMEEDEAHSEADLSAYSDDPDEDLSPASVGNSGRGGAGSLNHRRSTLRRCMTQNDFGRFAEMRLSIGSSSDDSDLQMMEVERVSVASPTNFAVSPIRRFGERHRDMLRRIVSLTNPVTFKTVQSGLLRTKQHDPQLFYSVGLWLRVQKAMVFFKFPLNARKFIHMLFDNTFADPEALPYLDRLK